MADGVPAPHRSWAALRDFREGHGAAGSLPPDDRVRPRGEQRVGPADTRVARSDRCLRERRQRVHRIAPWPLPSRVHPAAIRAAAVDRNRRPRLGQDDGVGPQRELFIRADAARHDGASRSRADRGAPSTVSGRGTEHSLAGGGRQDSAAGSGTRRRGVETACGNDHRRARDNRFLVRGAHARRVRWRWIGPGPAARRYAGGSARIE